MTASRLQTRFYALVLVHAAHSVEEYTGRLWDVFPPARFVTGLVSANREWGFIVINLAAIGFGLWCAMGPIRRQLPSSTGLAWAWAIVEAANALGHIMWSIRATGYTPGAGTAPLLLLLAVLLGQALRKRAGIEAGGLPPP
jgi:hypothetical protein